MKVVIILFIEISVLLLTLSYIQNKESFRNYLGYKTKCRSCEIDMIRRYGTEDAAWMANPSKSFDSEIEGIRQTGGEISGGFLGKSIRYF